MTQYSGTVIWFNTAKGYGFLRRQNGPDVCASQRIQGLASSSCTGQESVSFEIVDGSMEGTKRGTS